MAPRDWPKTERNAEIFARYCEDGRTMSQLSVEFRLSRVRIQQIILRQQRLHHSDKWRREQQRKEAAD